MRSLCSVLLLLAALVACDEAPAPVADAEGAREVQQVVPVARLDELAGDVRFRPVTTAAWVEARDGQDLRPADSVQTMARANAEVRFLEGGAVARLGPSTTLQVPEQPPEVTRLAHLSGRLVARVDEDQGRGMEVSLPPGTLVLEPAAAGEDDEVVARLDVASGRTEIAMVQGEGLLRRDRGGELRVDRATFVALDDDGVVVGEGALGDPVVLLSPDPDTAVRVRHRVELAWERHADADRYRLEIVDSAGAVSVVETEEPRASVQLASGEHRWTVRGVVGERALPAAAHRTLAVEVDRAPPPLDLSEPAPGAVVDGAAVTVAGTSEPGASIEVDGRRVAVQSDGTFHVAHPVPRGLVNVVVRAADDLGNARVVSRSVVRR